MKSLCLEQANRLDKSDTITLSKTDEENKNIQTHPARPETLKALATINQA